MRESDIGIIEYVYGVMRTITIVLILNLIGCFIFKVIIPSMI